MFVYEKKLQYPVKIANVNPRLASIIITQYGGPDGELGASLRYLSQRYSMPFPDLKGLLTDIGREASEMFHSEATAFFDAFASVTNSLNASHTRGLNQCRIRTTYPNIFARLSRRARCVCSWAITYSCASAKLLGKYIFGFRNPSAKGVLITCEI